MSYCNLISLFKWGPQTPIRFPPSGRSERAALTCIGTDSNRKAKHYYSHSADCTYSCEVQMAFKSKGDNIISLFSKQKYDCQVNTATPKKKAKQKSTKKPTSLQGFLTVLCQMLTNTFLLEFHQSFQLKEKKNNSSQSRASPWMWPSALVMKQILRDGLHDCTSLAHLRSIFCILLLCKTYGQRQSKASQITTLGNY